MKNGIIYKSDGEKLIEIYRLFNANGSLKRKLSAEEMVLIYAIGNVLKKKAVEDAEDTNVLGKWIPCSERLPENEMNVIAQFSSGTVTELRYAGNGIFEGIYEYSTKIIIAWMPLPEPYREEE